MAGEVRDGSSVLLCVNTGTEQIPTWNPVGGQSGIKITETNSTKERKGHKLSADGNVKSYEYDMYDWKVSLDGALVPDDAAYIKLKDACRNQEKVLVREITRVGETDTAQRQGLALITSIDEDGPYNDDSTFAIELQGTGKLTTTGLT
jgi:predicted secreted protein